ncbi:MAG: hypothetical protein ACFFA5_10380 [Promethearchaeota archaeon]
MKYYKKKGFAPLDISHWPPYKIPSIKRMLCTTNKKSDVLLLKDAQENPYAILLIKDWGRVVGVNQCYQVERLKGLLRNENVAIGDLKLILISRSGFSESVKRFARKQELELKSEADMTYEYPKLGEIVRRHRRAAKIAEEIAKEEAKDLERFKVKETDLELKEILELEKDEVGEGFGKTENR